MTRRTLEAEDLRKGIKFALVGGTTAIIYFALLVVLMRFPLLNYQWNVSIAYVMATSFHFAANRWFTFRAHEGRATRQLGRYVILVLINYLLTLLIVTGMVELLGAHPIVGACMAVGLTAVVAFLIARSWVFRAA